VKIKRLHENAILPHYVTDGASAFDVFAYEDVDWKGGFTATIKTGWAFQIPPEHALLVFSRSGHGFKSDTTLSNSVGVLDYDYRGELMIKLFCHGMKQPVIKAGQAVAQCILMEAPKCYFCEVDELSDTVRGVSGFGSTDKDKR